MGENKFPKKEVLGWIAWFDDKKKYNSKETLWDDLPSDGCLIVNVFSKIEDQPNILCLTLNSDDWYWKQVREDGDIIYGSDTKQTEQEIKDRYPGAVLLRGRWASEEIMNFVNHDARNTSWEE